MNVLYVRNRSAKFRHRWSQLFFNDGAAVPAPEPGLGQEPFASSGFDQPVQVGFTPTVTVNAIKPQRVALTTQVLESYQARHI